MKIYAALVLAALAARAGGQLEVCGSSADRQAARSRSAGRRHQRPACRSLRTACSQGLPDLGLPGLPPPSLQGALPQLPGLPPKVLPPKPEPGAGLLPLLAIPGAGESSGDSSAGAQAPAVAGS